MKIVVKKSFTKLEKMKANSVTPVQVVTTGKAAKYPKFAKGEKVFLTLF